MNKKVFVGATLVTATVVGGVVYFRHEILKQVDKWLDDGDKPELDLFSEATALFNSMTAEELAQFEEALKKVTPSSD